MYINEETGLKKPGITLFKKVLGILGCFFFMFSIILPFCHTLYFVTTEWQVIPEYGTPYSCSTYYWSFRTLYELNTLGGLMKHTPIYYWFYESGFYECIPGPLLSNVFLAIFLAQLLTLVSEITSAFLNKRILASIPLASSSLVVILMIHTNIVLSPSNIATDSYQLGYWLTYPAIILFLFYFILNIVNKKRSNTYTPTPTLTQ
jgi:hypothetical protein